MDFLSWLGAISFILTVGGLYLLGNMNAKAHLIFVVSYVIQIFIFMQTKQWFLLSQMIVLFGFAILNYHKWTKGVINESYKN